MTMRVNMMKIDFDREISRRCGVFRHFLVHLRSIVFLCIFLVHLRSITTLLIAACQDPEEAPAEAEAEEAEEAEDPYGSCQFFANFWQNDV